MKTLIILFCVIAISGCIDTKEKSDDKKYDDRFDNVDIDEILHSERLLSNYIHCLKTGEKCTADGKMLKDVLPDALQTNCAKCTEVQNRQSKKVLDFIVKNKPKTFRELEDLYDPKHIYRTQNAEMLKKEGIVLPDL